MATDIDIDETMSDQRQLAKVESLPPNLMLLKMENESMMAVARATPRDPVKIVKQLQAMIEAYPASADDAIYRKPVGTVLRCVCAKCERVYEIAYFGEAPCPKCESPIVRSSEKVKKYAEGLSIRAAESIRAIYGYNRLALTMEMQEDQTCMISGTFVDYATGTMTSDERVVSPFYTKKDKSTGRTPQDRFINVVVKAEKAKLRRDVILDSVPNEIKAAFRDSCEKKLEAMVEPEYIKEKILPGFEALGMTLTDLEKIVGRPMSMGWDEADRLNLRKIFTALRNGETSVAELISDDDYIDATSQNPNSKVSKSDLTDKLKPKPKKTAPKEAGFSDADIKEAIALADNSDLLDRIDHEHKRPDVREWCEARKAELEAT